MGGCSSPVAPTCALAWKCKQQAPLPPCREATGPALELRRVSTTSFSDDRCSPILVVEQARHDVDLRVDAHWRPVGSERRRTQPRCVVERVEQRANDINDIAVSDV